MALIHPPHKNTNGNENRMSLTRRLAGHGILLLAILGLLVCLGGFAWTWRLKTRVDAVGRAAFNAADETLEFVDRKLDISRQALERSRQSFTGLSRGAARLQLADANLRQECEPMLQTLAVVRAELQSSADWLDSGIALAEGVSRLSTAVLASGFIAARPESAAQAVALDARAIAESVGTVFDNLQQLHLKLLALAEGTHFAHDYAMDVVDLVAKLDPMLAGLDGRLENLDAKVALARKCCAGYELTFRFWTSLAAALAALLPVWFGLSQIVVIVWGWRMAHP
jgi:hypothetical protein